MANMSDAVLKISLCMDRHSYKTIVGEDNNIENFNNFYNDVLRALENDKSFAYCSDAQIFLDEEERIIPVVKEQIVNGEKFYYTEPTHNIWATGRWSFVSMMMNQWSTNNYYITYKSMKVFYHHEEPPVRKTSSIEEYKDDVLVIPAYKSELEKVVEKYDAEFMIRIPNCDFESGVGYIAVDSVTDTMCIPKLLVTKNEIRPAIKTFETSYGRDINYADFEERFVALYEIFGYGFDSFYEWYEHDNSDDDEDPNDMIKIINEVYEKRIKDTDIGEGSYDIPDSLVYDNPDLSIGSAIDQYTSEIVNTTLKRFNKIIPEQEK